MIRGQGQGKALMKLAEQTALKKGCNLILLETFKHPIFIKGVVMKC
ncbi:GNAT family N-acetyltransferase [Litoribacterium kuwaitense]